MSNQDDIRRQQLLKEVREQIERERYQRPGQREFRESVDDDSDRITTDIQNALRQMQQSRDKKS